MAALRRVLCSSGVSHHPLMCDPYSSQLMERRILQRIRGRPFKGSTCEFLSSVAATSVLSTRRAWRSWGMKSSPLMSTSGRLPSSRRGARTSLSRVSRNSSTRSCRPAGSSSARTSQTRVGLRSTSCASGPRSARASTRRTCGMSMLLSPRWWTRLKRGTWSWASLDCPGGNRSAARR